MIKAIIFDCFGVLYVDASRHFFEHNVANYVQLRPQLDELLRACDRGFISQVELNHQVAELTQLPFDFVHQHIQGVHQRNDALLDYVQSLRPEYLVGMLSNIGRGSMDSFFSADDRSQLFDSVVLSGDVGIIKPDPAIYALMATQLGVLPEECIMVDDLMTNIDGAARVDMPGIVFSSNDQLRTDLERLLETGQHA